MPTIRELLEAAFQDHGLTSRLLAVWIMGLISYALVQFFAHYSETEMPQATVLGAIFGLPTIAAVLLRRK